MGWVGPLIGLGSGILGNIGSARRESQFSGVMLDLLKKYANLTPEQLNTMMQQLQQPMSQGLLNTILRQVQASMGERGLADAPGLIAEATAQALGPYQFAQQQLSSQNLFDMLQLPLGVPYPKSQGADLSGLARLLSEMLGQSKRGSAGGGVGGGTIGSGAVPMM